VGDVAVWVDRSVRGALALLDDQCERPDGRSRVRDREESLGEEPSRRNHLAGGIARERGVPQFDELRTERPVKLPDRRELRRDGRGGGELQHVLRFLDLHEDFRDDVEGERLQADDEPGTDAERQWPRVGRDEGRIVDRRSRPQRVEQVRRRQRRGPPTRSPGSARASATASR
jgi:hypothetical protein